MQGQLGFTIANTTVLTDSGPDRPKALLGRQMAQFKGHSSQNACVLQHPDPSISARTRSTCTTRRPPASLDAGTSHRTSHGAPDLRRLTWQQSST